MSSPGNLSSNSRGQPRSGLDLDEADDSTGLLQEQREGRQAGQEPDPYAEDHRGIALLLQAAEIIEGRERAQIPGQQNQLASSEMDAYFAPRTTLESDVNRTTVRRPEGRNENVTLPISPIPGIAPDYAFLRQATEMFDSVVEGMMGGQNVLSKDQIDSLVTLHGDIVAQIDDNVQRIKMRLAHTLSMAKLQQDG